MAEQPSSVWISGGSAAATTALSSPASTAGGGGASSSSVVSSSSGAGHSGEAGSSASTVLASNATHTPRGKSGPGRKRALVEEDASSQASSLEERGGKRSRINRGRGQAREAASPPAATATERGRARSRAGGGAARRQASGSSSSSQRGRAATAAAGPSRHSTRHAPGTTSAPPPVQGSQKSGSGVPKPRSTHSLSVGSRAVPAATEPASEAGSKLLRENLRGRRAVTAASTAATASAVAAAAAAKKPAALTSKIAHSFGVPRTQAPGKSTALVSSRKRGLGHSASASSSASSSTSSVQSHAPPAAAAASSSSSSSAQPRKKYPLRNQVRLVPGSEEPVPLDRPRPPPEYYPPSNLGQHRRSQASASIGLRSLSARHPAATRATRASSAASSSAAAAAAGEKRLKTGTPQQQQQPGSPVPSLRRSSRSKTTTGSCASSSGRRTSRGGTKLPLASSSPSTSSAAPGPSSSSSAGLQHAPSTAAASSSSAALVAASSASGMAEDGVWEGLAEASASSSSARATPPPLPPPLLSSSAPTTLLAAAMTSSGGGQQLASASSTAAAAAAAAAAADSESDDSEVGLSCTSTSMLLQTNSAASGSSSQLLARTASSVGRLQALLEARGLPPHLFGALGPRMQHLLHRSIGGGGAGGGSSSKVQQLLQGLTATGDEGAQLTAVIEMCQMLVMGNEDTLAGFPVKQVVPALIALLSMEHNFDMMNHACRALTYMMEALPRSSAVVVDAVPVFLEKLQVIQCMDVAEQSLTALEMLSRRHGKAILQARGVSSCLTFLDFFSINAQRAALATTANCCMNLHPDEFHLVGDSLPLLASRLTQQDKRSMESVCLAFSRLVDSFQLDPVRLRSVASAELLANLQRILVVSPQLVSTGTFITVLRMLSVMCANCPALARDLLRHNVADTLLFLLTGNAVSVSNNEEVELVPRSPQELYEITCLIGELMPRLPTDGLFSVDALLERAPPVAQDAVSWQWRDDRELWHPYSTMDSRIIEAAHQAGEDEISLSTLGRTYTIDFHSMQQINEDTGTTRPVHRRVLPTGGGGARATTGSGPEQLEVGEADGEEEKNLAAVFIRSLFSVLYEVYSSSAGPAVRCKCLRALLRMVHFAGAQLLKEVLRNQVVSSHLAGMLASQDLRIVVGALQMAYILMQKLPAEFGVHFRREGVMHQIQRLADAPLPQTPGPSSASNSPAAAANGGLLTPSPHPGLPTTPSPAARSLLLDSVEDDRSSSPSLRVGLTEVLKRKRSTPKRGPSSSSRKTRQDEAAATLGALAGVPSSSSSAARDFFRAASFSSSSASGGSGSRSGTPTTTSGSSGAAGFASAGPISGSSRSRFSGAKSSFLASLNPARWGRSSAVGASSSTVGASTTASHNGQAPDHRHKEALASLSKSCSAGGLAAGNKEKARTWVREQAQRFVTLYFNSETSGPPHPALNVLSRLTQAIERLRTQPWQGETALRELRDIVLTSDISPFEVNHSGLIDAILHYLTHEPSSEAGTATATPPQPALPLNNNNNNNNEEEEPEQQSTSPASTAELKTSPRREHKLRTFLHVFAGCPRDSGWLELPESQAGATAAFSALVAKLGGCVAQLEQFPVKVHDLPSGTSGAGRGGGTSALKFFNTHQLKCNLQRHPSCSSLRQWKGGTVKIDPLALVQAIERYLVVRGYGRLRDKDSADSDDETEEDIDDTLAAVVISQGSARHKLQFLMGETPLPYNMTVYQAVRQFGASSSANAGGNDQSETDTDSEAPLAHAGLWVQTHTIYYRPAPEDESSAAAPSSSGRSVATHSSSASSSCGASTSQPSSTHAGRKGKGSSSKSNRRKEGVVRAPSCPLVPFLRPRLPENVNISDASLDVLCLLRVLHALSRHWGTLYSLPHFKPLLPQQEFVSSKISAKASRQLQDPLVIMTGNLPAWLQQVASACPFLFPFETRQLLFYATSFDRDRALQRLLEASPELNSAEAHERVTPRLDRRKRTVSRSDILRQAEQVVQDLATSRALLEVQYENEVGTGLGPTLEFYALVSRELQRADLELWLGDHVAGGVDGLTKYVHAPQGLFPSPLGRNAKVVQVARAKAKFRFLGRLMAKAVMDSRMLDLPFSLALYRTLLCEGPMLSLPDLSHVSPAVHTQLARLTPLARHRAAIEADPSLSAAQKKEAQEKLLLDGEPVSEIGLDFTLPGHPHIELRKGGKDTPLTIHNLDTYIKLVCHWFLAEGVSKQMESLRDGFEAVFPLEHLRLFYPEELEAVFCGAPLGASATWDVRTLMECCRPDHGYTPDSRAIRFLFEILSSYDREEQRQFLQFVTGSPRLPVGGFKSLNPPLTVVRKTLEPNMDPDEFLPSVMTCVNYLKLPDYSSIEVMRAKLATAAQEGQHSFHLS